jgi:hypothetical protein
MDARTLFNPSDELRRLSMEMMELVARLNAVALHLDLAPYTHSVETPTPSKSKQKRVRPTPGNHHKKWSSQDHTNLQLLIKEGNSRTIIAKKLERTPHAILCKQRQLAMEKLNAGSSIEEVVLWSGLSEEELEKSNSWRGSGSGRIIVRKRTPPSPSSIPKLLTQHVGSRLGAPPPISSIPRKPTNLLAAEGETPDTSPPQLPWEGADLSVQPSVNRDSTRVQGFQPSAEIPFGSLNNSPPTVNEDRL